MRCFQRESRADADEKAGRVREARGDRGATTSRLPCARGDGRTGRQAYTHISNCTDACEVYCVSRSSIKLFVKN